MNPEYRRKIVRETILESLQAQRPGSLPPESVLRFLKDRVSTPSLSEVNEELDYLEQKGLVQRKSSEISVAYVRWQITAAGIEYLEKERII